MNEQVDSVGSFFESVEAEHLGAGGLKIDQTNTSIN